MAAENMNPIALRSKNWIVESLFDLLAVKPLNRITISEIAENAELDRNYSAFGHIRRTFFERSKRFESYVFVNEAD